jgi:hypothetical protein
MISRFPSRSVGIPAQNQELVTQSDILKQIAPGLEDSSDEPDHETKRAEHTAEALGKTVRRRAFCYRMELLPTIGVDLYFLTLLQSL